MQKIITWIVIVGVIAVGGYFALNTKNTDQADMVAEESADEVDNASEGKKMAFSEFIKGEGSYKCTVDQHLEGGFTSKGIVYIDGKMVRGEFNSTANGLNVDSNMIVRDGYTYSWSSMTPNMGFKIKVVEQTGDTAGPAKDSYAWNSETIGDYDCEAWSADASIFVVPANISFQELGS